jgi:DNA-binding CsgD family transcriptional regulator
MMVIGSHENIKSHPSALTFGPPKAGHANGLISELPERRGPQEPGSGGREGGIVVEHQVAPVAVQRGNGKRGTQDISSIEGQFFAVAAAALDACRDGSPAEVLCQGLVHALNGELAALLLDNALGPSLIVWPRSEVDRAALVVSAFAGFHAPATDSGHRDAAELRRLKISCGRLVSGLEAVALPLERRWIATLMIATCPSFTSNQLDALRSALPLLIALQTHLRSCGEWRRNRGAEVESSQCARKAALTSREVEVLQCLASGLMARTIASRLGVSVRTVHVHLAHIYRKLETNDRLSAVNAGYSLGLIEPAQATQATMVRFARP